MAVMAGHTTCTCSPVTGVQHMLSLLDNMQVCISTLEFYSTAASCINFEIQCRKKLKTSYIYTSQASNLVYLG